MEYFVILILSMRPRCIQSPHFVEIAVEIILFIKIVDLFQDAISAAGVEPTTSIEQAVRDASSSIGVVESVKSETRKIAKNRLDKDPDFKQIGDSFPHSKSFARK